MECGQSDVAAQDWVWSWGPTEASHFGAHSFGSDVRTQCLEVYRGIGSGPAHAAVQRGQVLLGDRVLVVGAAQHLVSSGWVTVPALQQARSSRGHTARCCVKPRWHRTLRTQARKHLAPPGKVSEDFVTAFELSLEQIVEFARLLPRATVGTLVDGGSRCGSCWVLEKGWIQGK